MTFSSILPAIERDSSEKTSYSIANKIFFNKNLELTDCIGEFFDAEVQQMDFSTRPTESRDVINKWVEIKTSGKIKDLIQNIRTKPIGIIFLSATFEIHDELQKEIQQIDMPLPDKEEIRTLLEAAIKDFTQFTRGTCRKIPVVIACK